MALVLNGDGNITGLVAGGLPDGSVTADDIASTLDLSGKTVTLPAGTGGKVLQVVQANGTTNVSTSSSSYQDVLSASITPSSSSNKVIVLFTGMWQGYGNNATTTVVGNLRINRSGTTVSASRGNMMELGSLASQSSFVGLPIGFNYMDSPSTTSSTTYTIKQNATTGRVGFFADYNLLLLEIAG